jgi:hypothetical protein
MLKSFLKIFAIADLNRSMSQFPQPWDNQPKPWGREICRMCYVQSLDGISLPKLAVLAEVSIGTIRGWSADRSEDPQSRSWSEQRDQYQSDLRSRTEEKSIDLTSDRLAEQNAAIIERHVKLAQKQLDITSVFINSVNAKISGILEPLSADHPDYLKQKAKMDRAEKLLATFERIGGRVAWQTATNIMVAAINLERRSLGMDLYADLKHLESAAAAQGLSLIDLDAAQDVK